MMHVFPTVCGHVLYQPVNRLVLVAGAGARGREGEVRRMRAPCSFSEGASAEEKSRLCLC